MKQQNFRSRPFALLLVFFLGCIGAHHFYLGKTGWGFAYLALCWTGIPWLLSWLDLLAILTTADPEFDRMYNTV